MPYFYPQLPLGLHFCDTPLLLKQLSLEWVFPLDTITKNSTLPVDSSARPLSGEQFYYSTKQSLSSCVHKPTWLNNTALSSLPVSVPTGLIDLAPYRRKWRGGRLHILDKFHGVVVEIKSRLHQINVAKSPESTWQIQGTSEIRSRSQKMNDSIMTLNQSYSSCHGIIKC